MSNGSALYWFILLVAIGITTQEAFEALQSESDCRSQSPRRILRVAVLTDDSYTSSAVIPSMKLMHLTNRIFRETPFPGCFGLRLMGVQSFSPSSARSWLRPCDTEDPDHPSKEIGCFTCKSPAKPVCQQDSISRDVYDPAYAREKVIPFREIVLPCHPGSQKH